MTRNFLYFLYRGLGISVYQYELIVDKDNTGVLSKWNFIILRAGEENRTDDFPT